MKEVKEVKYVKLGEKAESFSDPISGFNLAKGEVKPLGLSNRVSKKVKEALRGGHLQYTSAPDTVKADVEDVEDEDTDSLESKTQAELIQHLKDNYEVTEDEVAKFSKMKKKDMVEYLKDLEAEAE